MLVPPLLAALLPLSLLACEPSPDAPPILVTPNYVSNVTYNTTVNVPPPAPATAPPVTSSPPPPPPPSRLSPARPPPAPVHPGPQAERPSTGMKVCDEYIARVESCSAAMLAGTGNENIDDSMELMRRNFRRVLRTHPEQRASLVDSCSTGLAMYNRGLAQSHQVCE